MIEFDLEKRIFKLDTENTSYIFGVEDDLGYLIHYYYGPKLGGNGVSYLAGTEGNRPSQRLREKSSFLDCTPMEYPSAGAGDLRETAFEIETVEGYNTSEFGYVNHTIYKGKKKLPDLPATFGDESECESLDVVVEDKLLKLKLTLTYSVFEGLDAIVRSVKATNEDPEKHVYITKIMSTSLDVENDDYSTLTLHGTWARERRIEYRKIGHGSQGIASIRGESSAQESPFIALTSKDISQTGGEVYAFSFVYSGNFLANAFLDQFNRVRVTMGINPYHFRWKLNPGESFTAPEVVSVYSNRGLGHMTRTFH
ncbi:MAG: alpha-galactosidase, partial [Lachnospiraceae bacterium]|nr:alpha-galactosidase [Lachnospiraceae bacterium]